MELTISTSIQRCRALRESACSSRSDRRRADLLTLEVEVAVAFDVRHRDGQHLLVDAYSRDPVRHRPLPVGAESVPPRRINQGRELSPCENTATLKLFGQSRTLRITQSLGLAGSMASLDLAAPSTAILHTP
jgi:hypothetical protein